MPLVNSAVCPTYSLLREVPAIKALRIRFCSSSHMDYSPGSAQLSTRSLIRAAGGSFFAGGSRQSARLHSGRWELSLLPHLRF